MRRSTLAGGDCAALAAAAKAAGGGIGGRSRSLAAVKDGRPPKFVTYRDSDVDEKTVKFLRVRESETQSSCVTMAVLIASIYKQSKQHLFN